MRKFILKRLFYSIIIFFFVMLIIYALMRCLPTSYIESLARQRSMQPGSKSYEEWMAQLTSMYNMDKGILLGYFSWLKDFFRGNFGDSWYYTVPVVQKFHETIWLSFWMGLISMFFELVIAIPLGIVAATKQYSRTDYTISVLALAGISLPTFFFASLLKLFFSVKMGWFDLFGLVGRNYEQLSSWGQFLDKA
ncbi:MAG: ABC transporter permease, partial [Oscillospiraceae bacterium]|nr:ABC transporter permease [Oscillospiraceae bacterium]